MFFLTFYKVLALLFSFVRGGLSCCGNWKKGIVSLLGIRGVHGDCNGARILGSVDFSLGGNRILTVVNSSNSNGAALLEYLGFLRAPNGNGVSIGSGILFSDGSDSTGDSDRVQGEQLRFKLIFRSFGLFPRCAIVRGVVLTPGLTTGRRVGRANRCVNTGDCGRTRRVVGDGTGSLLREMKLSRGDRSCPYGLDNNRRRHITVTETLTLGPSILYFSRPASTLSPRLANRILGIVHDLGASSDAVVIMARRVRFTESITSGVVFVTSNIVTRRNAPRRMVGGPRGPEARTFLSEFG